jgi:hypothetical protein
MEKPRAARNCKGNVRLAEYASQSEKPFWCLECQSEMILKQGNIRVAHFAHKAANPECPAGGPGSKETWQHAMAKQLLVKFLDRILFQMICATPQCRCILDGRTPYWFRKADGYMAMEEGSADKYRADVLLLRAGQGAFAAVEVHHKHAVPSDKRAKLQALAYLVLEVDAVDVLEQLKTEDGLSLCGLAPLEGGNNILLGYYEPGVVCSTCKNKKTSVKTKLHTKRPCHVCAEWHEMYTMTKKPAPTNHPFSFIFFCKQHTPAEPDQELCIICDESPRVYHDMCDACLLHLFRLHANQDQPAEPDQEVFCTACTQYPSSRLGLCEVCIKERLHGTLLADE